MKIGFDVISDLHLGPEDSFNWEGKATSLYCIVAGNISSDIRTLTLTLAHLANFYQGVFVTSGALEFEGTTDLVLRTKELTKACRRIRNVALLNQHVVIIDGIGILGCNGWYGNTYPTDERTNEIVEIFRNEDVSYLKQSIEKLQRHLDVKKLVVVTNSVPGESLYFGQVPDMVKYQAALDLTLVADTQHKVSHWVFGTTEKIVDTVINNINYVSNPRYNQRPYWAKRIEVEI